MNKRRLKKGLAVLVVLAMVVTLMPGVGTLKVSAAESGSSEVTFTATAGTSGAASNEGYAKLIDGLYTSSDSTKWCVTNFSSAYIIFAASVPVYVNGYSIVTGNDNARNSGRNPKTWKLYGSNDEAANSQSGRNSQSWVEIDSVENDSVLKDVNYTKYDYTLKKPTADKYRYFKLEIISIQLGRVMQMGEFILDYSTCAHNWAKTGETIDSTCTEGGYDVYQCTKCELKKNELNATPIKEHTWERDNEVQATCTEDGYYVEKCSVCQTTRNVANGSYAKGHTWGSDTVVNPTCAKKGYTLQTCSICSTERKINITDVSAHNYNDGTCSVCGAGESELRPIQNENGAYEIGTADDLYWFAGLVNGTLSNVEKNQSADAVLTADITINDDVLNSDGSLNENGSFRSWVPMGKDSPYTDRYSGTFDGQNHTISGLYFSVTDTSYVGLFGAVGTGGRISNMGVIDSYFSGYEDVGSVCGFNFGGTIENCYNTGTVRGDQAIGGVCGNNNTNGIIKNCYSTGKISGSISVGGICGLNYNKITSCYSDNLSCTKAVGRSSGTVTNVEGKTTEQFKSGEVCFLMNNGITDGSQSWYQNIDNQAASDAYPTLDTSHGTVYQCMNCTGVYSNTANKRAEHTYILKTVDKTKHICEKCSEEAAHALSELKYTADDDKNIINVTCGECNGELGTVTLIAPEETSIDSGVTTAATVLNTVQCDGFTLPAVSYKKSDGTNIGTNAPTSAGNYIASITLGTETGAATVSVEFRIGKSVPDIGTVSADLLYNTLDITQVKLSRSDSTVSGELSLKEGTTLQYGTHDYTYVFTPTGDDAVIYMPIEKTVSITVHDTIAPEKVEIHVKKKKWDTFLNSNTIGTFFRNSQDIVVKASDEVAGIDSIQYIVSDSPMGESEVTSLSNTYWETYSDTNKPSLPKGKHYVYVKVSDKAGNKTYAGTDCIVIYEDSTADNTDITYTYKENADKAVSLALNGNTVEAVTDKAGAALTADTDYTLAENGTITFKASYLDKLNASETAYPFTVSYNPQGETYVKNPDIGGWDLNDAPDTTTINVLVSKTDGSVTDISDLSKTYDGKAVSAPTFTSTNDTTEGNVTIEYKLASDEDSAYDTTAPKDAGQYLVRVTVKTDDNHKEAYAEKTFTISPKSIEGAVITLGDSLTFNGNKQTQKVSGVTVGNSENQLKLTASDYEVTGATQTNAGNYTLTVTGKGNFTGSATKDFSVAKAEAPVIEDVNKKYCYTTGSAGNTVTVDIDALLPADKGDTTYVLADNDASYVTDKEVSSDGKLTYKVGTQESYGSSTTLTVTATSNNYEDIAVKVIINFDKKIVPAEKEDAVVAIVGSNELTYGQKLSTLQLNKEEAVFVDEDDTTRTITGTLEWTNPDAVLAAGTTMAEWTFTPSDTTIYEKLTGKLAIRVEKAEPAVTVDPTVADRIYHPATKLADTDLTGATVLDVNGGALTGAWSWESEDIVPTANNSGYEAVFTPDDTTNYNTITKTITVNVTKATPYINTAPTAAAITYGDTLADATLTGGSVQYSAEDNTAVAGKFEWEDASAKPAVSDSGTTTYSVVFNPTDTVNYKTAKTTITLTVNKVGNAPGMPDNIMNVDYGKEKVSDITTLPEGWAWQEADKNTALKVGTPVTVKAVYTGVDAGNYETESVEISITRAECTHATTELKNVKAATCTVKGYTGDTYCKDCGTKLAGGKEIAMTDHKWDGGKVTKEPTETAAGVKTYTCSVCGTTKTEVIPKKTATTPKPPKKGDVVKDDKGTAKVEVTDVKKKEAAYKAPVNKKAKTVSIPATVKINGVTYKVTKIADNAFKNNKTITKVTIGSNIKTIGKRAFYGCKKLKNITVKTTKLTGKNVGSSAFKGIYAKATVKVPKSKLTSYKRILKTKGVGSKAKIKK